MTTVEQSIEVDVPVRTAYDQWTQFEEFPRFMENVEEVRQVDDTHLRWVAEVGGEREEWDAEIVSQQPDERIAWTTTSGKGNAGIVTFESIDDAHARINLRLTWEPEGMKEKVGSMLGRDDAAVKGDLRRFKELIEGRGAPSGGWRGTVSGGEVS
jgi:uncharacterized membrane protein